MSIDELMTSRSIVGRKDFPDYDTLDAMIASALKRLLEEQRAQTIRSILERKTNCVHDPRAYPCNWSLSSGIRTLRLVQYTFAE